MKHLKKFNPKPSAKTFGWMPDPKFKIKKVNELFDKLFKKTSRPDNDIIESLIRSIDIEKPHIYKKETSSQLKTKNARFSKYTAIYKFEILELLVFFRCHHESSRGNEGLSLPPSSYYNLVIDGVSIDANKKLFDKLENFLDEKESTKEDFDFLGPSTVGLREGDIDIIKKDIRIILQ
jgi:hypothetical protein